MTSILIIAALAMAAQQPQKPLPDKEVKLGSRLPQRNDWSSFSPEEVREVQRRYGECIVKKRASIAAQFVLNAHDGEQRKRLTPKVVDGVCLVAAAPSLGTIQMSFPGNFMGFALSDALVQRELVALPAPTDLALVPRLDHGTLDPSDFTPPPGKRLKPAQLAELEEKKVRAQAAIYLSYFGECVVRADPQLSRNLLATAPNSSEEGIAFKAIYPALAGCVDAGRKLELNKMTVRGTVAFNYYRLAKAPRVPTEPR